MPVKPNSNSPGPLRKRSLLFLACIFPMLAGTFCQAADPDAAGALDHCRTLLVSAQLDDGAIRMDSSASATDVVPYFSNLAAMALLAIGRPDDLPRVGKWIQWYADHQEKDGTIYDYHGTTTTIAKGTERDSTDSYAATYLLVLSRYARAANNLDAIRPLQRSAIKAVDAIALTQDPDDGLTWAKPDAHVKYLMDNLEVCCGLGEAAGLFDELGDSAQAQRVRDMQRACASGIPGFWVSRRGCYAWAKGEDGSFSVGLKNWYPDAMANLLAGAILQPARPTLWRHLQKSFTRNPQVTNDWWLRAALDMGTDDEIQSYRLAAIQEAIELNAKTQLDRAAWMALGLCWETAGLKIDLNR